MGVEICTVGGYDECGRNMTALKVDDEVVIFDMGIYLQKLIDFEEGGNDRQFTNAKKLILAEAIPDDRVILDWKDKVKAIVLGHCHLDHIAAVPYLADNYNCPIIGTPYTLEVLKAIIKDHPQKIRNKFKSLSGNSKIRISNNLEIEFINITHSTIQCVMVAVHTKYGIVVYANDFKLDNHPVVGKPPNYELLKKLGDDGVVALIIDSLYSGYDMKTPSEKVAREMLKDVLLGVDSAGKAVIVTTFSSHIARLKSIIDCGKKLNRKIVFLGRSLSKYVNAAENLKLVNFSKDVEIVPYASKVGKKLANIEKGGVDKYLIVWTGNQGEPLSVLNKIATGFFKFNFSSEDNVIFSCRTIPHPVNIKNRNDLEGMLKSKGVRIYTDIHVSGHGAKEDQSEVLKLLRPKHVFPSHGDLKLASPLSDLCVQMGYGGDKIHLMKNGQRVSIN